MTNDPPAADRMTNEGMLSIFNFTVRYPQPALIMKKLIYHENTKVGKHEIFFGFISCFRD